MARNIEELEKLYRFMDEHFDRVDMRIWADRKPLFADNSCGTTGCAAGWVAILSGNELHWEGDLLASVIDEDGVRHFPPTYARKALGLTPEEAAVVFYCHKSEILPLLKRLIAGEDILADR